METSPSPAARQAQPYLPPRKYVTPGGVSVEHYAHCIYAAGTREQLLADPVLRAFLPPADRPRLRRNGLRGFTSRVDGVCWMRLDPVRLRFHDKPFQSFLDHLLFPDAVA